VNALKASRWAAPGTRHACPTPVAGRFDFRLGTGADVDRIGVFFAGGRAWTRIC
jgi:hypothetical protein